MSSATASQFQPHTLPPTQHHQLQNGHTLAYSVIEPKEGPGNKSPVVLIIGWTGVKEDWHALPFHLASFGHRVLVYDHREFGESRAARLKEEKANETTVPKEKLTLELLADDCAELTRHVFPQQKVHCMGISMGGMIAQLAGARHPSLFHSLILGCTTLSIASPLEPPAVIVGEFPSEMPTTPAEHRALVHKLLAANFTTEWIKSNENYFEFLVDDSMRWKRPLAATMEQNRALGRFNGRPTVGSLKSLPCLILHGTSDGIIPISQAHVLANHLPQADIVTLPDVGHLFWTQAEKETTNALRSFLEKHETKIQQDDARQQFKPQSINESNAAKL